MASARGVAMASNEAKNEVIATVLHSLAEICEELANNSAIPEHIRSQAAQFLKEDIALRPARGKTTPSTHFEAEQLIIKISRFLPRMLPDILARPEISRD